MSRPDCTGGKVSPTLPYFKGVTLTPPPNDAGRFGTCGLGILEGPGMIDVDAGLAKRFNFGERAHLRFEASFTNVINHTNFAPPVMNIGAGNFGVLNTALLQGQGGNRTGQMALRLDF